MTLSRILSRAILCKRQSTYSLDLLRSYAKPAAAAAPSKKKAKLGAVIEKKVLSVESDTKKLLSHVCGSNIMKEGEDVKVKPDEEYPDWLWNIHIGPPSTLEELDPESKAYWLKIRKIALRRNNQLSKLRKF